MMRACFKHVKALVALVLVFLLVDFYLIFVYAPEERIQGAVQKIFYFHVSSAFAMYLGFLAAGGAALMYLWKRSSLWNAVSHAGASTGLLFCTMVLMSGPIWAKPIWGAWWTWDPRLTTTLILWVIFFSVILLRRFYGPDRRGRVYASVVTLFGVLDIPLVVFAIKIWRGIHPSVLGKSENMPVEMKVTLIFTNFTVLLLFMLVYVLRTRLLLVEEQVERVLDHLHERNH